LDFSVPRLSRNCTWSSGIFIALGRLRLPRLPGKLWVGLGYFVFGFPPILPNTSRFGDLAYMRNAPKVGGTNLTYTGKSAMILNMNAERTIPALLNQIREELLPHIAGLLDIQTP